jgi:hypothetical protein
MEEEAMYIWFEGVDGTWAWRGVRGDEALPAGESVRLDDGFVWSTDLRSEAVGTKGCEANRGDTDKAVTEAAGWAL